ncbi:MAG: class I SAM-dependent methyltransferase [Actinomycetota bacterium]|nr:class I SAM-dependent methyltransferase [Actinomycetota bacterium]
MSRAEDPVAARLDRERVFHDDLATDLDPARMPKRPLADLDAALLAEARVGPGVRVLDLGCGSGDLTLHLVASGAEVVALDLSPGMIDVARRRVETFGDGATATFVAAPVEETGFPDALFDVVVGRFILHHLDVGAAAREIARILRPGGRAVFAENSARNRLLMMARRHVAGRLGVPRLGTEDERPLSARDVAAIGTPFSSIELRYPVFEFFTIFDRQVLRFRHGRASRVLRVADRLLGRVPVIARYSFRVVVVLVCP